MTIYIFREGIIEVITTVRTERGGLSGLTTMDIINAAILVANRPSFERRFKVLIPPANKVLGGYTGFTMSGHRHKNISTLKLNHLLI